MVQNQCMQAYRKSLEAGSVAGALIAYRLLRPLFTTEEGHWALKASMEAAGWPSCPPPAPEDVVVGSRALLPWSVVLRGDPPWVPNLPLHTIPVSVIELACLMAAPEPIRARLKTEIVRQWEKQHIPPKVEETLRWFQDTDWEVMEMTSTTAGEPFYWKRRVPIPPNVGKPSPEPSKPAGVKSVPFVAPGPSVGTPKRSGGSAKRATKKSTSGRGGSRDSSGPLLDPGMSS